MIFAEIQDPRFFDWLMNQPDARQAAVDAYLNASLRYQSTWSKDVPSDARCKLLTQRDQAWGTLRDIHGITVMADGRVRVATYHPYSSKDESP